MVYTRALPALDIAAWIGLAYDGLVATALAYLFWSSACQQASGAALGVSMAAAPLCIAVPSLTLLHERPGPIALTGMCLSLFGLLHHRDWGPPLPPLPATETSIGAPAPHR